eukprot:TRINITY_DN4566_c0_g1_i1.p1 TRINITY_DN4566_c0_g1~~TRINITY_DN4566_c0_g1_i1.p1  ORF type:complete len:800 (-),score=468.60 TRINITY_DN4566_c0_g1_i1:107-2506(-)
MSGGQPYFVDHKRGEVNELKALLRNPRVDRDAARKREVIKKVIAYMTLGIDVSRLFSEMIMASTTRDLVQKKMVYLYLCTYAEQKQDLAILAINTLHKDCRSEDPMVRGLALRSLCQLRLSNINEYTMTPIRSGLKDRSAYVRKTAVMGVAKLHAKVPDVVNNSDLVDVLYNMLRDQDAVVVCNAIMALNDILADVGGMAINSHIIMHLLNRLKDFNEWAQCTVLDLVARYTPKDDKEMFAIMNLLEGRLKHANSAVVLGTTKVFLNFTRNVPKLHHKVFKRLKAPLLTLMSSSGVENSFSILSHITTLVQRAPGVFDDEFKYFFIKYNDPKCVKLLKLGILKNLANERNFGNIIDELGEYVTDVDSEIARKSIRCIADIAIKIDVAADAALQLLLELLDFNMDYVSDETCIVMKDLLRKFPERYEEVIPPLQKCLKNIEEEEGKVAVIWMIGEYGDTIRDAPYILEPLIDSFAEEPSAAVRMELLAASMKLFFKRPPEMKAMLGRLLAAAIEDSSRVDVRDRALFFYRLLKYNEHEAARVVNSQKEIVESFVENDIADLQDRVFQEFNSLSIVYNKPAEQFVTGVDLSDDEDDEDSDEAKNNSSSTSTSGTTATTAAAAAAAASAAAASTSASGDTDDILDFGSTDNNNSGSSGGTNDLDLDILGGDSTSATAAAAPSTPSITLNAQRTVDPARFQSQWGVLGAAQQFTWNLTSVAAAQGLEQQLTAKHIHTMATGTVGNIKKVYVFATDANTQALYLLECLADLTQLTLAVTLKTDQPNTADAFVATFRDAIASSLK